MPQEGTIYRILVASPSDCVHERKACPEIIYSWNAANSLRSSSILEPVLWETHATPELGDRPQAVINKQLVENCDLLVGIFWTRLGTSTGVAESGTAEEIEEFRKAGKPVLLYFSSAPVVPDSIDSEQYKALIEYKKRLQGEGIVFSYDSVGGFRQLFQRHLSSVIGNLQQNHSPSNEVKSNVSDSETDQVEAVKMYKSQIESFLRRLEAEWVAERDSEPHNINDARYILDGACSQLLDFKAQITHDHDSGLSNKLQEAIKRLKILRKHQLYMDGGASYRAFWEEGNAIIALIEDIPRILDIALELPVPEETLKTKNG